ncbi:MAG: M1 family metallopeptidase [Cyanobacteria bacterium SZAS LIN-3]|nr:M1 family metallopeptidase [Cyanobacteria bacterium SZAS LIN-3]
MKHCNLSHRKQGTGASAQTLFLGSDFRLPKTVVPSHYEIELTPDFQALTFRGNVAIDVDVVEPVSNILINAHQLTLGEVTVVDASSSTSFTGAVSLDEKLQRADIKVSGVIGRGKWRIKMAFEGVLNDELKGFYRSIWKDENGKEHVIATTQFEACDARRAFPCFDEPEFKATFKVIMNIPHDYQALSAMREESVSTMSVPTAHGLHTDGESEAETPLLKRVEFHTTPVMSTYFLAFMAGELECGGSVKVNGKELRFWSTPGKSDQLNFAKGIAAFSLAKYEDYFGIPYHGGDKIDFVAVPDFAAGAMENLGCIIYRETDLLANEKTASQSELERVAHVVAHELAHMWFGDYATMRWWNGLWLNESFATYMENKVVDWWKPEWHTWDAFAAERVDAFGLDQLKSTHAIEVAVENPLQIDEIFDLISYQKGCSVLRMLEQYIGDEAFRRGSQRYLKTHALGNTETYDLWDALELGCHETGVDVPVRKLMDGWVFTSGHPVVSVKQSSMAGFIELSQKEFKVLNDGPTAADSPLLWPIPITLKAKTRSGVVEQKFLFGDRHTTVYIGEDVEWVVVNANGSGFYRVLYSQPLAAALVANKKTVMTEVDRYNFLSDTWACVRARLVPMLDYLKITEQFLDEEDAKVWGRIIAPLNYLHTVTDGPVKAAIEGRIRHLLVPILNRVGLTTVEGESVKVTDLRKLVIGALGTTGKYLPVVDKAREMYAAWKADPTSVDGNVFGKMVYVLAEHGDKALHSEFNALRTSAKTAQEQSRFMYALTSFKDTALIKETLDLALSGEIRVQDAAYFFASLLGNEEAMLDAWKATKDNWGKITDMWPEHSVPAIFDSLSSLDTPELEADVVDFFTKKNTIEFGQMQLAQGLEQLRINVLLRKAVEAEREKLAQYLMPVEVQGCVAPNPEKKQ